MSSSKTYMGTKPALFADTTKSDLTLNFGIYKGVVKKIDTQTRNGRLFVYVEDFGGANPDLESSWVPVNYASPFGGVTTGPDYRSSKAININRFGFTQQTYGFSMIPPDVGNQVLCCFPQGQTIEGYWFACVNPNLSKYMTPALGAVTRDMIDSESFVEDPTIEPLLKSGNYYPVGEFNINNQKVWTDGWASSLRPLHTILTRQLIHQGLDGDPLRGAITSSMQRDAISSVFGISTPGRPVPGQDPARSPELKQKLIDGTFDLSQYVVTTRVGGHSIVMDDGDFYGNSNLMRFKTAAGHQIMMHDTEGFIYVSNAAGTAWIELTKAGDVLIYSGKDLAIRTHGNIMMHSDKNIMLEATQNFSVSAGSKISFESKTIQTNAKTTLNLFGKKTQLKSGSSMSITSSGSMSMKASGKMSLNGGTIALNGGGGGGSATPPSPLATFKLPDAVFSGNVWQVELDAVTSIVYKLPSHEPYLRNANVSAILAAQEEEKDDQQEDIGGNPIDPPVVKSSEGATEAGSRPVKKAAPESAFIKQPPPRDGMGVLSQDQLQAYMAQTGYSESGGKYDIQNQFGYQGKYQMGSGALQDLGYLKPGTKQTPEEMNNPANWTGKNGITSAEQFRASAEIQEQAMYDYTKRNYTALQNNGLIKADTPPDTVAGLLSSSHLVGPGAKPSQKYPEGTGTYKWYVSGGTSVDGNGTTAADYFNRGKYSQTQVGIVQQSNASKIAAAGNNTA